MFWVVTLLSLPKNVPHVGGETFWVPPPGHPVPERDSPIMKAALELETVTLDYSDDSSIIVDLVRGTQPSLTVPTTPPKPQCPAP